MKGTEGEATPEEKRFLEENFGGSHQVYPTHNPEFILTVNTEKNHITKDINSRYQLNKYTTN